MSRRVWRGVALAAVVAVALAVFEVSAAQPERADAACSMGTSTLRHTARSSAVMCLEQTLREKGFLSSWVDGYFGTATVSAVRGYQRANGLYVDGVVGPQTGRHLGIWGDVSTPDPDPAPDPAPAPDPGASAGCAITSSLRLGMTGCQVLRLETVLRDRGLQSSWIDSYFGTVTQTTIREYQRANGLYVDGVVGPQTGRHLGVWGETTSPTSPAPPPPPPSEASGLNCSHFVSGRHAVIDRVAQRYVLCEGNAQYGAQRPFTAGPINDAPKGLYSVFFERSTWWGGGFTLRHFTAFTYGDEGGRVAFHKYVDMPSSGIGTEQYRNTSDGCFRVSASDAETTQNFLSLGSNVLVLNNG